MKNESILNAVQEQYGMVARSNLSNDSEAVRQVAQAFGYTEEELASIPAPANMGLSCGNPVAIAGLREGEVVVDLGSGGGLDVFLAAKQVGLSGKAIGIDMTPEMVERAKAGAASANLANVEFHLAHIDALPLADSSVDCVISNCVINLAPDKAAVFREIARVLKPGGRLVVSDIALKQPLPAEIQQDLQAYVGCIAGAIQMSEYEQRLRDAGFEAVVQDTGADLNVYAQAGASGCCDATGCCSAEPQAADSSPVHNGLKGVLNQFNANDFAASIRVHALKPSVSLQKENRAMKTIQIYDKPMCCSTGICGPQVDPVLPRFAADLDWLKAQGHTVERYNLAQQPQAFVQSAAVQKLLAEHGVDVLPVVLVDGRVVSRNGYPSRESMAMWAGIPSQETSLPIKGQSSGSCCGDSGCC